MKIKVNFEESITVGKKTFEGEMEFEKPLMGLVVDANEFYSVHNEVGINMAMVAGFLDVPLNLLREMDIAEYTKVFNPVKEHLPKLN